MYFEVARLKRGWGTGYRGFSKPSSLTFESWFTDFLFNFVVFNLVFCCFNQRPRADSGDVIKPTAFMLSVGFMLTADRSSRCFLLRLTTIAMREISHVFKNPSFGPAVSDKRVQISSSGSRKKRKKKTYIFYNTAAVGEASSRISHTSTV